MRFAIIEEGVVANVVVSDEALSPNWIATDTAGPGWSYDAISQTFAPPAVAPDLRPRIVIVGVTSSDPAAAILPGDVTLAVGSTVTVAIELRDTADALLPLSAAFRMPLTARDGRERMVLATFDAGAAVISTTLAESGCWQITERAINSGLPEAQHMRFDGLQIFVIQ